MSQHRSTRQRQVLLAALLHHPGFVSAQALHAQLISQGQAISLATVYRNLQALVANGDLDVIHSAGQAAFRACGQERHHHHLVCRSCGAAQAIEVQAVEDWAGQIATRAGFSQVQHTLELSGLCPACTEPA